jgi:hypothetical protein
MKPISRAAAFESDGKKDERREALGVGLVVLEPFQQSEGEIEDVDALFFFERSRVVPDVEQALLQRL